jgi:inhibitor of KinA
MQPAIVPLGDSALTVIYGTSIDEKINDKVQSLFLLLQKPDFPEIIDIIPAYASLTIIYDVIRIQLDQQSSPYVFMRKKIEKLLANSEVEQHTSAEVMEIPVCYDVVLGKDLITLSKDRNLSIEDIVQLHSSAIYRVYMIGFLPGFAYMGKVDNQIAAPRKTVPDRLIPAGSVGIAGEQTGIYPLASPGGWNIIGRTPLKIFDTHASSPCLLQPGLRVKFRHIVLNEYYHLKDNQ